MTTSQYGRPGRGAGRLRVHARHLRAACDGARTARARVSACASADGARGHWRHSRTGDPVHLRHDHPAGRGAWERQLQGATAAQEQPGLGAGDAPDRRQDGHHEPRQGLEHRVLPCLSSGGREAQGAALHDARGAAEADHVPAVHLAGQRLKRPQGDGLRERDPPAVCGGDFQGGESGVGV